MKTEDVTKPGFYDGEVKRLTAEEIAAIYPTAPINLEPMTSKEKFARVLRNMKQRGNHWRKHVAPLWALNANNRD